MISLQLFAGSALGCAASIVIIFVAALLNMNPRYKFVENIALALGLLASVSFVASLLGTFVGALWLLIHLAFFYGA